MTEIAFAAGVAALLGGAGLAIVGRTDRTRVRRRLGIDDAPPAAESSRFGRLVARTGLGLTELQAAGVVIAAAAAVAGFFGYFRPELWLIAAGLAVGAAAPLGVFVALQSGRRNAVRAAVPDLLDHLARGLRAGQTLSAGLETAAADDPGPLTPDLRRCRDDLTLGLSATAALDRLAERVGVPELDAVAAVADAHGRAGGDLAAVFDRLAAVARDAAAARAQARAATALGRASAALVASAMPALLLYYVLAQPKFLGDFWTNPAGQRAVGLAVVLELVGVVCVWRLLKNDD